MIVRTRRSLSSAAWAAALLLGLPAAAAAQTWNADANGSWNTAGNWSPATVPNAVGATVSLGDVITFARTITLSSSVTLGTLNVTDAGGNAYTLSSTGAHLTFNNNGSAGAINVLAGPSFTSNARETVTTPVSLVGSFAVTNGTAGGFSLGNTFSSSNIVTGSSVPVTVNGGGQQGRVLLFNSNATTFTGTVVS